MESCRGGANATPRGDSLSRKALMTTYKPFCSLECNREYSATVAGGGYGHGPNDEPYCLNCGARTEAMPSRAASRRRIAHRHPTDPPRRRATRRHAAREYTAWGCTDCAMFVANGEPPLTDPATGLDWSQAEEEAWVQAWENRNRGIIWSLGNDEQTFSWSACDLCGSTLGGGRHEFYGFDHG